MCVCVCVCVWGGGGGGGGGERHFHITPFASTMDVQNYNTVIVTSTCIRDETHIPNKLLIKNVAGCRDTITAKSTETR